MKYLAQTPVIFIKSSKKIFVMKKKISKILSLTALLLTFGIIVFVSAGWERNNFPGTPANKYPADVAIAWVKSIIGPPAPMQLWHS